MNRNVLFGVVLFVVVFICHVGYTGASDNHQLITAINNLTRSIEDLDERVDTLNSKIDVNRLTREMKDLEEAITDLERTIRNK